MRWLDLARISVVRPLLERPARTALAAMGIAFGVALYVAIALVNRATIDRFAENLGSLAGTATVSVHGGGAGFPEETIDIVEQVPGVARVVPLALAHARLGGGDADHGVTILGVDMLRETAVRAYGDVGDALEILNEADAVLVPRELALEERLVVGSRMKLVTTSGLETFVVRGILEEAGPAKAFGSRVVFMDIDAARLSFGKEGLTDRLDVVAEEGAEIAALERDVGRAIGPALRVERPSGETRAFRRMVGSYRALLCDLSRLALVVAVFLVAGTMNVVFTERRKEIGVLRAIGATRRLVLASAFAQAAVLGAAGALVGLVLGRSFAIVLVGAVGRSIALRHATAIDVATLELDPTTAALGVAAGLAAAAGGGLLPAIAASGVAPASALRPESGGQRRTSRGAFVIGAAILAAVAAFDAVGRSSLTLAFVASALVAPTLAELVLSGLAFAARRTPGARLAAGGTSASGSAILALALVLVVLVTTAHASLARGLADATARMLSASVLVSESGAYLSGESLPLPESLSEEIARVSGVGGRPRAQRVVTALSDGASVVVRAWDRMEQGVSPITVTDGDEREALASVFNGGDAVIVSRSLADRAHKRAGDRIEIVTPSGPVSFTVAGVSADFAPEASIHLDRATYVRLWRDTTVTTFFVDAAEGIAARDLRDRIDAALGRRGSLVVRANDEVRAHALELLDEGFAYTRAIEAVALLVSLLGLASQVLVSMHERRRSFALLRAVGMSRAAIGRMIAIEMSLVGIAAGIVSCALAGYLARYWLGRVLVEEVGWPLDVYVPAAAVVIATLVGLLEGLAAGIVGGHRAASVDLRAALAGE